MPSFCLPPLAVWAIGASHGNVIIEAHENYQKRSLRNKFYMLSANGIQSFSIPLRKGKNNQQNIKQVEIAYEEDWVLQLARQLQTNYGNAPYFDYYFDGLFDIAQQKHPFLFDLNHAWMQYIINTLQLHFDYEYSSRYVHAYPNTCLDLRSLTNDQLNMLASNHPEYEQVYGANLGHIAGLSIIDVLFCLGPETRIMIEELALNSVHLSSDGLDLRSNKTY